MPQYPLPQFIEEEGKIVFFLTFRQFFLLVGGAVACFLLYYTLPFYLFVPVAILIMMIVSAIAFLKIEDEKITKVILHSINFYTDDKSYTWKKGDMGYQSKEADHQTDKIDETVKEYNYTKTSSTSPIANEITNVQSSKL